MNELDKLINELIKEKGGTKQQYLHLLNSISKHETGGTNSPTQKQVGGGPGRGKYQFEIGKHQGGITAAKRLQRYYKNNNKPVPKWLSTAAKRTDLDASTLTGEQQDLLFLGNMREHPRADLGKVMSGEQSVPEFWVNNHWAGPKRQRQARLKSFNSTYKKDEVIPDIIKGVEASSVIKPKDATYVPQPQIKDLGVEKQDNVFKKIASDNIGNLQFMLKGIQSAAKPVGSIQKAYGGQVGSTAQYNNTFSSYGVGGLHETNPNGGIPLGPKASVEQNETSFNFPNIGKYIFSHRIGSDGKMR